jgi:hypothetical protein
MKRLRRLLCAVVFGHRWRLSANIVWGLEMHDTDARSGEGRIEIHLDRARVDCVLCGRSLHWGAPPEFIIFTAAQWADHERSHEVEELRRMAGQE